VLVLTAKDLTDNEIEMLRRETIGLFQKGREWKKQLLAELRRAVGAQAGGMSKKILVADDNAASRELIREVLEMSGYDVIEAADGRDAVTCTRESAPDLVLVDIQMPRLDGYGVLRELRADPASPACAWWR
jgi:PleD family two-component response regulator